MESVMKTLMTLEKAEIDFFININDIVKGINEEIEGRDIDIHHHVWDEDMGNILYYYENAGVYKLDTKRLCNGVQVVVSWEVPYEDWSISSENTFLYEWAGKTIKEIVDGMLIESERLTNSRLLREKQKTEERLNMLIKELEEYNNPK